MFSVSSGGIIDETRSFWSILLLDITLQSLRLHRQAAIPAVVFAGCRVIAALAQDLASGGRLDAVVEYTTI